jgi:putative ABC transport system substrate-binding protein
MAIHIGRREFVVTIGSAAATWPLAAHAQAARRIAVLFATGQNDIDAPYRLAAMREVLKNSGWIEGKNLWVDIRFGDGDTNLIQRHAAELVAYNPDVILVLGTVVVSALKRLTRSIPIVFVQVSDPVQAGFVSSLSHPGGNITGFTTYEYTMAGKWLEVIKDFAPSVTRVLFLLNPENSAQWAGYSRSLETFGRTTGVNIIPGPVRNRDDIDNLMEAFGREPGGGLLVPLTPSLTCISE